MQSSHVDHFIGTKSCIIAAAPWGEKSEKGYVYKKFVTPGQTFDLIFKRSCSLDALGFQFSLRLLVVLGGIDTMLVDRVSILYSKVCRSVKVGANLVVVDNVEPRKNMDEQL